MEGPRTSHEPSIGWVIAKLLDPPHVGHHTRTHNGMHAAGRPLHAALTRGGKRGTEEEGVARGAFLVVNVIHTLMAVSRGGTIHTHAGSQGPN